MSRTYKDRFYCAYSNYCWEEQNSWGVGVSSARAFLKKYTNRKMRRFLKGNVRCSLGINKDAEISNGGAYKKMFVTVWDVW